MKRSIVLLICAFIACVLAEVNWEAANESKRRLKEAHGKCQANSATAVDEVALMNMQKGGPRPANLGPYTVCVSKAMGWQNEDGSINRANIESGAFSIYGRNSDAQNIIDECAKTQESVEATAALLFKCYIKHSPRSKVSENAHH